MYQSARGGYNPVYTNFPSELGLRGTFFCLERWLLPTTTDQCVYFGHIPVIRILGVTVTL